MKLQIQHTTVRLDTILSLALTENIQPKVRLERSYECYGGHKLHSFCLITNGGEAKKNITTRPERAACRYRTKREAMAVLHGYAGIAQ